MWYYKKAIPSQRSVELKAALIRSCTTVAKPSFPPPPEKPKKYLKIIVLGEAIISFD